MGAAGFGTLAGHFADRTVVTYDPRGCTERSRATVIQCSMSASLALQMVGPSS